MNPTEAHAIEPGQDWSIDLFRPEDAQGVTRLFLSVYGKDYPIKTYIDPDRLIRENTAGRVISSVARTPRGDIVGHNALFASAPYPRIAEIGAGVVHRSYRGGKGIFTQMALHGIKAGAERFGLEAVYGESVCNHVFSQKMTASIGAKTHAVEVDLMPAAAYGKEKSAEGRVSSLLDVITLVPKPHTVFLPAVYEQDLGFIYEGLDDRRELNISRERLPAGVKTEIDMQVFDFAQVARLAVRTPGEDFAKKMHDDTAALSARGIVVLQVWLNLSAPGLGAAADHLRTQGFFFGGLLPRWFDADGLLMQKISGRPNWAGMQIQFDRAKVILDRVKTDWERTQALR